MAGAKGLVSEYVDKAAITANTDFLISEYGRARAEFENLKKSISEIKETSSVGKISNANKSVEESVKQMTISSGNFQKVLAAITNEYGKLNAQQKKNLQAEFELFKYQEQGRAGAKETMKLITTQIAQEQKLEAGKTKEAEAIARTNIQLQNQKKEITQVARLREAEVGSNKKLDATIAVLTTRLNKLNQTTDDGKKKADLYNKSIGRLFELRKQNSDPKTAQALNIGNYEGSAKIIVEALEKARVKVEQVKRDFGELSPEANKARGEFTALERITSNPQFLNISAKVGDTNAELRFFNKQLNQLEDSGLKNSAVYKDVQQRLAKLTDQLGDTRAEIKALASDTRGFDLFAGSVSFAADAMQTAAGAAALFGASEKEVEEITKNLIAIQSVANGVKGIANELTTKGTAANKAFAFIQGLVTTATNGATAATVRLNAALKLSVIGLAIAGIALLIVAYDKLTGSTNKSAESQDDFNKRMDEGTKAMNDSLNAIDKTIERRKILNKIKATGDEQKSLDTETEITGISQKRLEIQKELNKVSAEQNKLSIDKANLERAIAAVQKNGGKVDDNGEIELIQNKIDKTNQKFVELNRQQVELGSELTNIRLNQIADTKQKEFDAAKDNESKLKELRKKQSEDAKSAREKSLQEELDFQKRKADAISAIITENNNERIRVNEAVAANVDNEVGIRLNAEKQVQQFKRAQAAKEYTEAIADEKKVQDGVLITIKKSDVEKLLAKTIYDNKVKVINEEAAKANVDIIKDDNEKKRAQIEKDQELELQLLLEGKDKEKNLIDAQYNNDIVSLNERLNAKKISQKDYDDKRLRLDNAYHIASLEAEVKYTQKVLAIMKLRGVDVTKELAALAGLEKELSDLSVRNLNSNEEKKKKIRAEANAEIVSDLEKIQQAYQVFADIVNGFLNASVTSQKNKIQEQLDNIDKEKEAQLEANDAKVQSEQDKAANILIINSRAQIEKEKLERRQREIDRQKAQAEKFLSIFQITLATAVNVAKAATPFQKILAAISGAAQLAIAIATPLPKFFRGKSANDSYAGYGTVNEIRDEVIERANGAVEFPTGRDVVTYLDKGDIVHPDKNAWLDGILNAAHRDANRAIPATMSRKESALEAEIKGQTKLLKQIANRPTSKTYATEKGLRQVMVWGSRQIEYKHENTDW